MNDGITRKIIRGPAVSRVCLSPQVFPSERWRHCGGVMQKAIGAARREEIQVNCD